MKNLVSVIVPVYNAELTITNCLESLVNQSYEEIEIIIVNNKSTDKTQTILDKLAQQDSRIKCYEAVEKGVSNARNYGVNKASGEYITFVDADDYLENDAIAKEVLILEDSKSDMAFFDYVKETGDDKKTIKQQIKYGIYKKDELGKIIKAICDESLFASVWRGIYKKKIIENVKFRNIKYAEDMTYNIEIVSKADSVCVSVFAGYHYVYNQDSALNHLQYDLNNTILLLSELKDIFENKKMKKYIDSYVISVDVCCMRVLNSTIKYNLFKSWIEKMKLMDVDNTLINDIAGRKYLKLYIKYWLKKIIRKIKSLHTK